MDCYSHCGTCVRARFTAELIFGSSRWRLYLGSIAITPTFAFRYTSIKTILVVIFTVMLIMYKTILRHVE
jgi:hypothetical protein